MVAVWYHYYMWLLTGIIKQSYKFEKALMGSRLPARYDTILL